MTSFQARSQDFLWGGGGGGCATEAKVDQTIEMNYIDCLSHLFRTKVAIHRNCNGKYTADNITFVEYSHLNKFY